MRMGFIAPVVRARSRGALTCTCGAPPNTVLKLTPRPGVLHNCSEAASAAAQLKTNPLGCATQ